MDDDRRSAFLYGHPTLSLAALRHAAHRALEETRRSASGADGGSVGLAIFGPASGGAWLLGDRHPKHARQLMRALLAELDAETEAVFVEVTGMDVDLRRSRGAPGAFHDPSNGEWAESDDWHGGNPAAIALAEAGLLGMSEGPIELLWLHGLDPAERTAGEDLQAAIAYAVAHRPPGRVEGELTPEQVAAGLLDRLVEQSLLVVTDERARGSIEAELAAILDRARRRPAEGDLLRALEAHPAVDRLRARKRAVKDLLDETVTDLRGRPPSSTTGWI